MRSLCDGVDVLDCELEEAMVLKGFESSEKCRRVWHSQLVVLDRVFDR